MKDFETIVKICERVERELPLGESYDRFTMLMDIELAIDLLGLDIDRLLAADSLNFNHDIVGIINYIDRPSKTFMYYWSPRHTLAA